MIRNTNQRNDGRHEVMALARLSWGRGPDAKTARAGVRKQTEQKIPNFCHDVPKGAWIDETGLTILWDKTQHPDERCQHCTY